MISELSNKINSTNYKNNRFETVNNVQFKGQSKEELNLYDSSIAKEAQGRASINIGQNSSLKEKSIFIDEETPLLPGATIKQLEHMEDIAPENLVLVHMTNYYPENGQILSTKNATMDDDGISQYRSTVHFAINQIVKEHEFGNNWSNMKYGLILPFDKTMQNCKKENILGGMLNDFFIKGNVKLPDNSVIVKYNPDIPDGKLKITNASRTSKDFEGTEGILMVESSNSNMQELVPNIIEKMGYKNIDKLHNDILEIPEEILNDSDKMTDFMIDNIDKITEIKEETDTIWKEFCSKYDFTPCFHTYSPWGRSESLITAIQLLSITDDKWDFEEEEIDYKKEFIKVINEIKEELPKEKSLSYDIDKMEQIIIEAEKPSECLEKIKDELHLMPMPPRDEVDEIPSNEIVYYLIDALLAISDVQKASISMLQLIN